MSKSHSQTPVNFGSIPTRVVVAATPGAKSLEAYKAERRLRASRRLAEFPTRSDPAEGLLYGAARRGTLPASELAAALSTRIDAVETGKALDARDAILLREAVRMLTATATAAATATPNTIVHARRETSRRAR